MKVALTLFFLLFAILAHAETGKGGHGTAGYLCTRDDGSQYVIVYDIFKLKQWSATLNLAEGSTAEEIALNTVAKIKPFAPYRAALYSDTIREFDSRKLLIEDFKFEVTLDYKTVVDLIGSPNGCSAQVIVNQVDPNAQFIEDSYHIYRINKKMWKLMSKKQKAVVLIHEAIYKEMIAHNIHDALYPINLTTNIISKRMDNYTQEQWDNKLKELELTKMFPFGDGHYKRTGRLSGQTWYRKTIYNDIIQLEPGTEISFKNYKQIVAEIKNSKVIIDLFGESKTLVSNHLTTNIKTGETEIKISKKDQKIWSDNNIKILEEVVTEKNQLKKLIGTFNFEYAQSKFLTIKGSLSLNQEQELKDFTPTKTFSLHGQTVTKVILDPNTKHIRFIHTLQSGWLLLDDRGQIKSKISNLNQSADGKINYSIMTYKNKFYYIQKCTNDNGVVDCKIYDKQNKEFQQLKREEILGAGSYQDNCSIQRERFASKASYLMQMINELSISSKIDKDSTSTFIEIDGQIVNLDEYEGNAKAFTFDVRRSQDGRIFLDINPITFERHFNNNLNSYCFDAGILSMEYRKDFDYSSQRELMLELIRVGTKINKTLIVDPETGLPKTYLQLKASAGLGLKTGEINWNRFQIDEGQRGNEFTTYVNYYIGLGQNISKRSNIEFGLEGRNQRDGIYFYTSKKSQQDYENLQAQMEAEVSQRDEEIQQWNQEKYDWEIANNYASSLDNQRYTDMSGASTEPTKIANKTNDKYYQQQVVKKRFVLTPQITYSLMLKNGSKIKLYANAEFVIKDKLQGHRNGQYSRELKDSDLININLKDNIDANQLNVGLILNFENFKPKASR